MDLTLLATQLCGSLNSSRKYLCTIDKTVQSVQAYTYRQDGGFDTFSPTRPTWRIFINVFLICGDGGEAGKLHPGLWKIPPRLLENPTQGLGPPWVLENSTQGFGKSLPGFWKIPPRVLENPSQVSGKLQNLQEPCDYTFLDKQVTEEKLKNDHAISMYV